MARSRSPIGSSMSGSVMTCSTSWTERMFLGSVRPSRGRSISDAGLCRMWFCRVSQRNHTRKGTSRVCWRAEGQRLAVLLAVEEQVPLIAFEHGPRDFDGFAQAVFIGPFDEEADDAPAILHRVLGVAAHTAARSGARA